jgi:hypothetical protein
LLVEELEATGLWVWSNIAFWHLFFKPAYFAHIETSPQLTVWRFKREAKARRSFWHCFNVRRLKGRRALWCAEWPR